MVIQKIRLLLRKHFEIQAIFNIDGQCNEYDSADVVTEIFGGTPPYSTLWSNGDITPNTSNLQPNPLLPYSLSITDNNGCQVTEYLYILPISSMKTFSSNVGVICKDDKSAEVRVFVSDETPFTFGGQMMIILDNILTHHHQLLTIYLLGIYYVKITDNNLCVTFDTVEVVAEYNECLNPKKVFSPNNDGINDIWEIENINIYPTALVEIYSKNGYQSLQKKKLSRIQ